MRSRFTFCKITIPILLMVSMGLLGYLTYYRDGIDFREAISEYKLSQSLLKQFDLTITKSSDDAHIMLMGDSHAMTLQPGLKIFFGDQIALNWAPACIPFYDVDRFDHRFKPGSCLQAMQSAFNRIETDPKIRAVVLSSMGPVYLTGKTFHDPDLNRVTGQVVRLEGRPDIKDAWEVYRLGMINTFQKLSSLNKIIIFVIDVPELGFKPQSCLVNRRDIFTNTTKQKICAFPRSDYDKRVKKYRELVNDVAPQFPNVVIIDPSELFCDADWCWASRDGNMLYHDIDHLSDRGSYLLGNLISQTIQSKPDVAKQILPIVQLKTPISFSGDVKKPTPYTLISGWASSEKWGVWSVDHHAILTLPLPSTKADIGNSRNEKNYPSSPAKLVLSVKAMVERENSNLRFRVSVNQGQFQDLSLSHGDDNLITIPITEAIKKVGFMSIQFEIFNPIKPKDIGMGVDDRLLGIGLKSGTFY